MEDWFNCDVDYDNIMMYVCREGRRRNGGGGDRRQQEKKEEKKRRFSVQSSLVPPIPILGHVPASPCILVLGTCPH